MVCKEDVVLWFKELESYKRIDTMCTLLNMCLPFELRFLGTCLEELGNKDSSQLRGIELRVNNSAELASEIAACQLIEPSDIKVRRKMALYLAMIRACNRPCVEELFKMLNQWSNHEIIKTAEGDPLQELLLVYTMAANHPVFTFEQRMKCGEIFNKIKTMDRETTTTAATVAATAAAAPTVSTATLTTTVPESYDKVPETFITHNKVPGTNTVNQPNLVSNVASVLFKPSTQSNIRYSIAPTLAEQSLSFNVMSQLGFEPSTGSQIIRDAVNISPNTIIVDSTQPVYQPVLNVAHISQNPSASGGHSYTIRTNVSHPLYQPQLSDQSESPSQPSSPIESRSSSPRVKLQSSRHSYKHESRSSSLEATQQPPDNIRFEMYSGQTDKGDLKINKEALFDDTVSQQLQSIYNRNGYVKQHRPRQMGKPNIHQQTHSSMGQQHQQQQQQQQQQMQQMYITSNPNGLAHAVHNLSLVDTNEVVAVNTEDEVSSGESIDDAPPDTPHITTQLSGSGGTKTSSNKKNYKSRELPLLARHKVPHILYNPTTQGSIPHVASNTNQQITHQGENIILSPTVSPQLQQTQQQTQQQSQQQQTQQQTNVNINVSNLSGSNNNLITSAVLIPNKPSGIVTTPSMASFGIPTNAPVIFQQYPPPQPPHHIQQQSQINTTYQYQQIPMNNRASILPTPNTTTPGVQSASYRIPPYHLPPNGEVIYPYQTAIAYMPTTGIQLTPINRPASHQAHPAVPTIKHSSSMAAYPTSETKVLSCFNCGAHSHTGRDCQESSIEEVTRGTVYKLDYNSTALVDTKSELDNGLDASSLPPVTNK